MVSDLDFVHHYLFVGEDCSHCTYFVWWFFSLDYVSDFSICFRFVIANPFSKHLCSKPILIIGGFRLDSIGVTL